MKINYNNKEELVKIKINMNSRFLSNYAIKANLKRKFGADLIICKFLFQFFFFVILFLI